MSEPMYVMLVTHSDGVDPQLRLFTDPDKAVQAMADDAIAEHCIQTCENNRFATVTPMNKTHDKNGVLETASVSLIYCDEKNKRHTYDWLIQAVVPEDE